MSLESENWQLLQDLFHLAEATPPADRERILFERCSDPWLCRRALELVTAADDQDAVEPPKAPTLSGKIGPYSLLRHLGAGGIGSVYLVERRVGATLQRSALKVLSPHSAGPAFVERFHREQHILATLDHPNITRLTDAGLTDDGQPYLVMEYVDGTHLDTYCDQRKLGIPERIALLLHVCDAVAYAHRNLVVHLDLKPSNILVTHDGTVKLLDFGTSKLIRPDSMFTTTVLATPAYASPEQLRNEPVTTACDIYALGGILFQLLAGHRPSEAASAAAMIERAIREEEPENLAHAVSPHAAELRGISEQRLRQILSGDVATIVQKCLRQRPRERYASLDALTEDLDRYLAGRPVLARPQTVFYRAGKFVRRNRAVVTASGVALLALVAALAYAEWRQQEALREGQRALHMQAFMYRLFKLANPDYTGKPAATVPEFLNLGVKLLPDYIKDPADLRAAQLSLAESMYESGDLDSAQKVFTQTIAGAKAAGDISAQAEAEAFSGNIAYVQGDVKNGESLTADALALSRRRGIPPDVKVWSAIDYAWNRDNEGYRSDENLRLLRYAAKESQDSNLPPRETANAFYNLGEDLELRGFLDDSEVAFNQALAVYAKDPAALCEQAEIYAELGYVHEMRGDIPSSLPIYQRAYDEASRCSGPLSRGALTPQMSLAGALIKLGRANEALPLMEGSIAAWRKMLGTSPDLAEPLYYLSRAYVKTGNFTEGEKYAKELVDVQEGKVAPTDRRFGASHMIWAEALAGQGRYRDALPHAEIADRLLATSAVSPGAKQMNAEALQTLEEIQAKLR